MEFSGGNQMKRRVQNLFGGEAVSIWLRYGRGPRSASSSLLRGSFFCFLSLWNSAESVRVAAFGPQVHAGFESAAEVGLSPAGSRDWSSI